MDRPLKGALAAVALSGGVDSLCALLLLKRAGARVIALHGRLTDAEPFYEASLKKICAELGADYHTVDLRGLFEEKITAPFARGWLSGLTPNPCAVCNREIKFGALYDKALSLGADFFATGHYARIARRDGRLFPAPGRDRAKDQSYFLSLAPQKILDRLVFPLADLEKSECRRIVEEAGLAAPEKKESQDICFLRGAESRQSFIRAFADKMGWKTPPPGPIRILERAPAGGLREIEAGTHKGLYNYTIGQRRGASAPYSEPLYALAKNGADNSLLLAPRAMLGVRECVAGALNLFAPEDEWPDELYARMRSRQRPARARAEISGGKLRLIFEEPQFPGAEGQIAVLEDSDGLILAAGIIEKMRFEESRK